MVKRAIHVKTETQYRQLLPILEILGYRWTGGGLPTDGSVWKDALKYGDRLCIGIDKLNIGYSPIEFYKKYEYKIISFEEFYAQNKPKPSNLNSRLIEAINEVYKIT